MSIWKIVSGILSIVLCFFVIFQSCAAGIVNAMTQNGDVSGSAGLIVAILLLAGGIVSIATRDAIGNGGNIALIILFGLAAFVGYVLAGSYGDLVIWATWCLLCAVLAAMAIAADNVCSAWVYILIAVIGVVVAVLGFGMNASGKDGSKKSPDSNRAQPAVSDSKGTESEDVETFDVLPKDGNSSSDEGSADGSGTLGDYYVEIKGAAFDKDYEGNSAIVITYSWTNNSENTTNASVALFCKAFQDGVQIDSASLSSSNKNYDSEAEWRDIRPGTTLDVQCAFKTDNKTSPIEVEISEAFSFSDSVVTMTFDPSIL